MNKKGQQGTEKKDLTISATDALFFTLTLPQNSYMMLHNRYK